MPGGIRDAYPASSTSGATAATGSAAAPIAAAQYGAAAASYAPAAIHAATRQAAFFASEFSLTR